LDVRAAARLINRNPSRTAVIGQAKPSSCSSGNDGYLEPHGTTATHRGVGRASPEVKAKLAQRRKIRVFLQDGAKDIDNGAGNWPLANLEMAAALGFRDRTTSTGARDMVHASSIFPDTMRWLCRDHADHAK
jgi:hypothetical protein